MHYAVAHLAPLPMIELLLARGANVNAADERGHTPLDWLQRPDRDRRRADDNEKTRRQAIIDLLVAKGAKPGENGK